MSVYKRVQVEMDDIGLLCEVLDDLAQFGLEYIYDPDGKLNYHKWRNRTPRGRDGTIVINRLKGGLDTTPRRYCGDTAFCVNEDGTVRVELDIAHGNAPVNWNRIQNLYALKKLERTLPRGYEVEHAQMDPATGAIEIKVRDTRRTEREGRERAGRERRVRA